MTDPLPSARSLAELSARAYREHSFATVGGVEVLMDVRPETVVLAFRGTEKDGRDIVRDLRGYPWWARELGCWVHRGFLVGARNVMAEFPWHFERPVHLTGHSKGGAEATVVAALMCAAGRRPRSLVTFGSPRTGSWGLGRILAANGVGLQRYVFGADFVTQLPLLLGLLRVYCHVAPAKRIGRATGDGAKDHRIAGYVAALSETQ